MKNSSNFLHDIFGLENKTVLLTGAAGQLGRVISKGFLDVGAKVIGVDLKLDQNKVIKAGNISYYSLDIANKKSVQNLFNDLYNNHSEIDVLINNAGVSTFEPFNYRHENIYKILLENFRNNPPN